MLKLKGCENRNCKKEFEGTSNKRFCSLACKNTESYLKRKEVDEDEIQWRKGYERNNKIISLAYEAGSKKISVSTLEDMGFKSACLKSPLKDKDALVYLLKDFILKPDQGSRSMIISKKPSK